MVYNNLKTKGKLTEISQPTLVERVSKFKSKSGLIFPENIYLTRVEIQDEDKKGSRSTEIFGIIPQNYINKQVELVESYHKIPGREILMQEFYVDGQRVINQVMIKRK